MAFLTRRPGVAAPDDPAGPACRRISRPHGTYYCRVQAIDSGLARSPWSHEVAVHYDKGDGDVDLLDCAEFQVAFTGEIRTDACCTPGGSGDGRCEPWG